jgi:hypothetical protein
MRCIPHQRNVLAVRSAGCTISNGRLPMGNRHAEIIKSRDSFPVLYGDAKNGLAHVQIYAVPTELERVTSEVACLIMRWI